MASGEEDREDLEEEFRRRRAEAEDLRQKSPERSYYSPDEKSFFAPTSEDRAEQARRAASRVRRRAEASEPQSNPSEDIAPSALDAEPKASAPEPAEPEKPAPPRDTLIDRAAAKTPPARPAAQQTEPEKPAQSGGSILDRAVGLAGAKKPAPEQPKPDAPKSETASPNSGSIMDRAVQRPSPPSASASPASKPNPDKPAKPAVSNRPPISESLMDRAMKRPVSQPKPPASAGSFKPNPVLSAAAKPLKPPLVRKTPATPPTAKAAPQPPRPGQTGSKRPDAATAKPDASLPLSDRLKKLAETKSPGAPPAQKEAKTPPVKPNVKPTVAAPVAKAPAIKAPPAPVADPEAPKVAAPKPPKIDPIASPQVPAESIYADQAIVTPTSGIRTAKTKAFAAFEWMIASRYLRARKKEGFVSVIAGFSLVGIALGVATLIVVMAVMTGFRDTLVTQIIGGSPHINVYSQSDKFENYDALADQVRVVDGVTNVTPVVQGQVLGTGNQRHTGVIVRGMRKADLERLIENAEPEVLNGTLENFVEDKGVALGAELAAKLGLRVGDFITLISPDGDITPFQATPMPRVKDYKIIQTFKLGVQEIDYGVAFMPFAEAQIYFNKQNQADTLDVFVDDPQSVSDSLRNIEPGSYEDDIFQSARSSISVNNWKNLNGRLIGAINLERQVMFVILTMIILVAALNIISGLVMLVKDKARDVAIMRTMGMARGSVLRIFFICGSSIGVIGSLAGVILGVLFVLNIHTIQGGVEWITGTQVWDPGVRAGIEKIPTKLQLSDVAMTLFIALGLSFIATLFPAWKAAKLDPVEALRYE